jgi:hypothetical protein
MPPSAPPVLRGGVNGLDPGSAGRKKKRYRRCVSKVSFIRRSDEFLESIKKGIETSNPSLKPNSLLAGKIQGILRNYVANSG